MFATGITGSVNDLDYLQSGMCFHPQGRSEWLRGVALASPAEAVLLLIHLLRELIWRWDWNQESFNGT